MWNLLTTWSIVSPPTPGGRGSDDAAIINLQLDSPTIIKKMPSAKKFAQCVHLYNQIYVGEQGKDDISIYDLQTNLWNTKALPDAVLLKIFKIEDRIYVITTGSGEKEMYDLHDRASTKRKVIIEDELPHSLMVFKDLICP